MRRFTLVKWYAPLLMLVASFAHGQQLQIIRADGTVENIQIRTFDTQPTIIPIKPYGMNLKPANVPDRVNPYSPVYRSGTFAPPVTIENPYFPDRAQFPVQENCPKLEIFQCIGEILSYTLS